MTITDHALDAQLKRWATSPAGDSAAAERIIRQATAASAPASRRPAFWAGSGLIAAALTGGLLLLRPAEPAPAPEPAAAAGQPGAPDASFAALYTPTPDEEMYS